MTYPQGGVDTSFISQHEAQLLAAQPLPPALAALAAATFLRLAQASAHAGASLACQPPPAAPLAACALARRPNPEFPRARRPLPQESAGAATGGALPGPWGQPSPFRLNHLFSCPVAFSHPRSGSEVRGRGSKRVLRARPGCQSGSGAVLCGPLLSSAAAVHISHTQHTPHLTTRLAA